MIRALAAAGLLFVSPALAGAAAGSQNPATPSSQAQDPTPTAPQAPASNSPKPKPKKVWTNENLADAGGTISVVGTNRSPSKAAAKPAAADKSVDPKILRALREQLQKLQSQLAVVDQQLSDLKDFGKGDSKNAGGLSQNTWQYNSSSVDEQIQQLQGKKTKIQASIDELLDAARASGIEPGQLR
jgi:hypothetical protein